MIHTFITGSWNSSFIVSDNGRSKREKSAYLIDGTDDAYTFQTYAGKPKLMDVKAT